MIYSDPGEHARENSRAEGANKIIEEGIQSLLYEKTVPPIWWQRAANNVQFLGNRHPPYSLDANVLLDGDMASPIERMFLGYVSHGMGRRYGANGANDQIGQIRRKRQRGSSGRVRQTEAEPPLPHGRCAFLASWPLCLPCFMAAVPSSLHGRCASLAPWPRCLSCFMAPVPALLHGRCAPLCSMALPASCPALAVDSAHRTPPSKAQHHLLRSPTSAPRYPTAANTAPHCPSCGVPQWIFLPPHLQPPPNPHPRLSFPACHCLAPHYASCLPRNVPAILLRDCLLDLPCVIFDTLRRHLHHPGLLVKHPQS